MGLEQRHPDAVQLWRIDIPLRAAVSNEISRPEVPIDWLIHPSCRSTNQTLMLEDWSVDLGGARQSDFVVCSGEEPGEGENSVTAR